MALLDVKGLTVHFPGHEDRPAVNNVDLTVERGTILGIVGETGAGKTLTTRGIVRAVGPGVITAQQVEFEGVDLLRLSRKDLRRLRGGRIGIVVQDARSALNPMQRVGKSLALILRAHERVSRGEARTRILSMLASVGLPDPERIAHAYPHELSGGMAQRTVIAAALLTNPDLLIADEATTGLDVTVQAQILDLLKEEIGRRNTAAIVVTHDLGIVAHYCTDVMVMYGGEVRERGPVRDVFSAPEDPYTAKLLQATAAATPTVPAVARDANEPDIAVTPADRKPAVREEAAPDHAAEDVEERLLRVRELVKHFTLPGRVKLHAVNGVTLDIERGETLAVVGESGAGKSTVGRCLLRLVDADGGEILFDGADIARESRRAFRGRRTEIQAVFQDPSSSLDQRMRALAIVSEPLEIFRRDMSRAERREEGLRLMESVGLEPELADRLPSQLSGGQQQRVAIARAIATRPRLIVLDEPTASLDMSVRSQVLSLLEDLQQEHGLSYLFISHDLNTVRRIATRVIVMYLGEIVEVASTEQIFERPRHPYTRALLSATLVPDPARPPARERLEGETPRPTELPDACHFASRCPIAIEECEHEHPELVALSSSHKARCIRLDQT